ncbi:hypothetical protein C8R45DRAFT_384885 [Mycena sanguinolenta]|nr:hypothetical protein C8R45DRAFT_384885 [Mycena sanguinolenta]
MRIWGCRMAMATPIRILLTHFTHAHKSKTPRTRTWSSPTGGRGLRRSARRPTRRCGARTARGFEPIRDLAGLTALPPPLEMNRYAPTHRASSIALPLIRFHLCSVGSASSGNSASYTTPSTASNSIDYDSTSTLSSGTEQQWWPLPALGMGGTRERTSDSGWGCMLWMGQSLLATGLGRVEAALHVPVRSPLASWADTPRHRTTSSARRPGASYTSIVTTPIPAYRCGRSPHAHPAPP